MANLIPMTPERWAEKGCGPDGQPLAKGKAKSKATGAPAKAKSKSKSKE